MNTVLYEVTQRILLSIHKEFMRRVNMEPETVTDAEYEQFAKLQVAMWNAAEEQDKIRKNNGTQKEE